VADPGGYRFGRLVCGYRQSDWQWRTKRRVRPELGAGRYFGARTDDIRPVLHANTVPFCTFSESSRPSSDWALGGAIGLKDLAYNCWPPLIQTST